MSSSTRNKHCNSSRTKGLNVQPICTNSMILTKSLIKYLINVRFNTSPSMKVCITNTRLGLLDSYGSMTMCLTTFSRCFKYENLVGCSYTCPRFFLGSSIYILCIFLLFVGHFNSLWKSSVAFLKYKLALSTFWIWHTFYYGSSRLLIRIKSTMLPKENVF